MDDSWDDTNRIRLLLAEASQLLGDGSVLLQIVSEPVIEWVFVGTEDEAVVVSDNGETFAEIAGIRGHDDTYVSWSVERARTAAARFGVELVDEGGDNYEGFRLRRVVKRGERVAPIVQAVAHAIDGTLALHTPPDAPSYGSFFWDTSIPAADE